jgi:hypothetical protein
VSAQVEPALAAAGTPVKTALTTSMAGLAQLSTREPFGRRSIEAFQPW